MPLKCLYLQNLKTGGKTGRIYSPVSAQGRVLFVALSESTRVNVQILGLTSFMLITDCNQVMILRMIFPANLTKQRVE